MPSTNARTIRAFGCVLYEMLTGTAPFDGDNVTDVIAAVVTKDPDWSRLPQDTPRSTAVALAAGAAAGIAYRASVAAPYPPSAGSIRRGKMALPR